jgi:hypothetical protein
MHVGSLNDLNILDLSPFLESFVDGTFSELEKNCGKAPNEVNGNVDFFACQQDLPPVLKICQRNPDASDQQGNEIYSMAGVSREKY